MSSAGRSRRIYLGDNLGVLAGLDEETIALAYCDPPFNSGRNYEADLGLGRSTTRAFDDMWTWSSTAEQELRELGEHLPPRAVSLVSSLVDTLGRDDLSAYLVMMAARLGHMHRALRTDGSLYVHCDPSASHYLKILLDHIFGAENFRNEVIWRRTHAHSSSKRFGPVHDVILFYSKTKNYTWNQVYAPYSDEYLTKYFTKEDERGQYQLITCTAPGDRNGTRAHYSWKGKLPPTGRHWAWTKDKMEELEAQGLIAHSSTGTPRLKRYADEGPGVRVQDVWNDIGPLSAHSNERTGFETQKPLALLRRIIEASTDSGDHVLDAFSGSGTTAVAAEATGRSWTAMDSSLLSCSLTLARIHQEAPEGPVALSGFPTSPRQMKRVRDDEPVTYAAWGTGMLGTVLDKDLFTDAIAGGHGQIAGGGARQLFRLRSWVPLKGRVALGDVPDGTDVDHVFVMDTGAAIRNLAGRLEDQRGMSVIPVALEECLDEVAHARGLAPTVAAASSA